MSYNYNPLLRVNFETRVQSVSVPNFTSGRIPFATGSFSLGQDTAFHWDNANKRLGLGTATPLYRLSLTSVSGSYTQSAIRFVNTASGGADMSIGTPSSGSGFGASGIIIRNEATGAVVAKFTPEGRLGMGVATPTRNLEISSNGTTAIVLTNTAASGRSWIFSSGSTLTGAGTFNISDLTASQARFTITAAGNVCLGAVVPNDQSRLQVNGGIQVTAAEFIYFGAPNSNGTVRIGISGTEFVTQIRTAGIYVTKGIVSLL